MTRDAGEIALLGPESPFVPESGSAHAYIRRPPVDPPDQATESAEMSEGREDKEPNRPAFG